jgi:hypothetical protein
MPALLISLSEAIPPEMVGCTNDWGTDQFLMLDYLNHGTRVTNVHSNSTADRKGNLGIGVTKIYIREYRKRG